MLLYYITDRRAFGGGEAQQCRAVLDRIAAVARAGVDYIQLREKDLSSRNLEQLAKDAVAAVSANSDSTRLLINARTDIALVSGADGVHLPSNELPASEVRAVWMRCRSQAPTIAASAHTLDEMHYAHSHGADFAVLAPIFGKFAGKFERDADGKPVEIVPGIGLEPLRRSTQQSQPPDNTEAAPQSRFTVLALGNVTLENVADCLRAGAAGIAGIRLFQEGDVAETVRRLRSLEARP